MNGAAQPAQHDQHSGSLWGRPLPAGAAVLLSLLSGGLLVLAYPKFSVGPIAWVALVPWLWVVFAARTRAAVLASWLMGLVFFGGVLYWIALFGPGVLGPLLVVMLGLLEGLAVLLTAAVVRIARPAPGWPRIALTAAAWVGWEWVRSVGQFGFAWAQLGHSQLNAEPLREIAAYAGVPGISFLIVLANASIAEALADRARWPRGLARVAVVGLVVAAAAGLGQAHVLAVKRHAAWAQDHVPPLRVAIVQTSVSGPLTPEMLVQPWRRGEEEHDLAAYEQATREAAAFQPRLVVWPESAIPGYPGLERDLQARLARIARDTGVWLLVGGHHLDAGGRPLNSAFLVDPSGRMRGRYDKVQLVPFGEYVPGRSWLPLLRFFTVREDDVRPGPGFHPLEMDGIGIGTAICFESTFPHIGRALARRGAKFLVVITNDAWFRRTAAPEQHLEIGAFRAVEEGMTVVRAAATGISCFITPWGQVGRRAELYDKQVLVAEVYPSPAPTLYRRLGPALPRACLVIMAVWIVAALWRRSRLSRSR